MVKRWYPAQGPHWMVPEWGCVGQVLASMLYGSGKKIYFLAEKASKLERAMVAPSYHLLSLFTPADSQVLQKSLLNRYFPDI